MQPQRLHGRLPGPLRVLHRQALALLAALVGQQVQLLPTARLGDQPGQHLHGLRSGGDELGPVRLRRAGLQPHPAVLEIDLIDRKGEDLPLPEAHEAGQQDAVGEMLGHPLHDRLQVIVGHRAGQVLRFRQPGHLGQLGKERASAGVLQPMDQPQGLAKTDQIAVDGRVGALAVGWPVELRRIRLGIPLLRSADIDHDRLFARPGDILPYPLFGDLRCRHVGTEPDQHLADIDGLVGPVLSATLARRKRGEGLREREGAGRNRPWLFLGRLDLQHLLDALGVRLGLRRFARRRIDAIAGMPLAIPDEIIHPAAARLV
ncbi:hypothetical protein ABMY26_22915 [Azospirillum sp. HJ39]